MKPNKLFVRAAAWFAFALVAVLVYGSASDRLGRLVKDNNAPYARFTNRILGFVSGIGGTMRGRTTLQRENDALNAENAKLNTKLVLGEILEKENASLRKALDLSPRHSKSVVAIVASRDTAASGWLKTVRIDKGSSDGVKRYSPVVNEHGLVGRVVEVSDRTSDVLLLTDPNSRVSCYIEREGVGAHGVLSSGGVDNNLSLSGIVKPFTVEYLGKDIEIRVGDRVLTSGHGGAFPRDLPVGEVMAVETASSGLYQTARIVPFADFNTLSLVFVLPIE